MEEISVVPSGDLIGMAEEGGEGAMEVAAVEEADTEPNIAEVAAMITEVEEEMEATVEGATATVVAEVEVEGQAEEAATIGAADLVAISVIKATHKLMAGNCSHINGS